MSVCLRMLLWDYFKKRSAVWFSRFFQFKSMHCINRLTWCRGTPHKPGPEFMWKVRHITVSNCVLHLCIWLVSVTIQFLSGHLFRPDWCLPQVWESERKKNGQGKGEGAWKEAWMNGLLDWKMRDEKEGDGRPLRIDCLFNAQSI